MSGNEPSGHQPGPYGSGPQGPQNQGPQNQGPQYQGPQYQGPQNQGPQNQGPQYQGPQYQGPQNQGPQYQGPQHPGPQQPGAQYSGPFGQGYGQHPGQPAGGGPGGPTPYGPGPGGPGGPGQPPTSGKNNTRTFVIIGVVVLALIVVGLGIGALVRRSNSTAADPVPPGGGGTSQNAPAAAKQSDAVRQYLEALATGKSEAILATLDKAPADKTFMTDEVLAQSIKRAPLTDINVTEVTNEYSSSVDASYKLGDTPVTTTVSVTEQGGGWKVRQGYNDLDLTSRKSRTLPMLINGVAVKANKVNLLPGSYEFTTGAKYITYGDESTLLVDSPTDYPRGLSDVQATLSADGEKAFIAAVKKSADACLKSNKLGNKNCPNNVDINRVTGAKPKDGTIEWTVSGDPYSNMRVRIDYDNPAVATASWSGSLRGTGDCASGGGSCYVLPFRIADPQADMTKDTIAVSWVD